MAVVRALLDVALLRRSSGLARGLLQGGMTTSRMVLPCIAAVVALSLPAFAQPMGDHVTCYKVKDSAGKAKYDATLATDAGSQDCLVRAPAKYACVPTTKSNVTPTPPGGGPVTSAAGSFLCYRVKCRQPAGSSNVTDQFGQRVVTFRKAKYLCTPADVPPPAVGVTTTTTSGTGETTTTLPAQDDCTFEDGQCAGTCAIGGSRCGSAVGDGSCECRDTPCGDADTPECNGFCEPDEACVFDLSGCSCVNVP